MPHTDRGGNIENELRWVKAPWSSTNMPHKDGLNNGSDGELLHTAKSHRGRSLIVVITNDVPCEQIFDHIEIANITSPLGKKNKNDQLTISSIDSHNLSSLMRTLSHIYNIELLLLASC